MNRIGTLALLLALPACFKGSATAGTCSSDADCAATGSVCNPRLHVCAYACDHVCSSDESCVDGKCAHKGPSVGVVAVGEYPLLGSNGFFPRAAGLLVPVTVTVDYGTAVAVGDAKLLVAGQTFTATSFTVSGSTKTFQFQVPSTVQTPGSEAPVQFQISAADGVVTVQVTPLVALKIDDAAPVLVSLAPANGVTVAGTQWFRQSDSGTIDVIATITDNGSGVDFPKSVQLLSGSTRIDNGSPEQLGNNQYRFHVPRTIPVLAPANSENSFGIGVAVADHLGHSTPATASAKLGIDGVPPTVTGVTVNYPAKGTGCDSSTAVTCGHDGNHFWRRGDAADGSDAAGGGKLVINANDKGSGLADNGGTCTITGSSKGCTVGGGFAISPNFTDAVLTASDPTSGGGLATVNVTVRDAVGNLSNAADPNAQATPAVSRLRWARTLSANPTVIVSLAGAPIVTKAPIEQIIVAGNAGATDPIAALSPTGSVLWTAGRAQSISSVTANMAWDPTPSSDVNHPTPMLYVVATDRLAAIHPIFPLGATPSIDPTYTYFCSLTSGVGAPAIAVGGPSPKMLVADTATAAQAVIALGPSTSGKGCASTTNTVAALPNPSKTRDNANIGPPTIGPGGSVYFGFDNSVKIAGDAGFVSASLVNGSFTSTVTANVLASGINPQLASGLVPISIAGDLFFPSQLPSPEYVSVTTDAKTINWSVAKPTKIPMAVAKDVALAGGSGTIYAYAKPAISQQELWNYGGGNLGVTSPLAIASDGMIYFSDSMKQFVALAPPTGTSPAAPKWTFVGPASVALTGTGNEPTISANGIVYFTDNATFGGASNVYALIADVGAPVTAATAEWPRTGFDNCNSGNSSFTTCN